MTTFSAFCTILFALLAGWTRADLAAKMVDTYESQAGHEIEVSDCPFTDTGDFPEACKAWEIEVTAGTSATTFSPSEKVRPYQAFLFAGKTMYALERMEW